MRKQSIFMGLIAIALIAAMFGQYTHASPGVDLRILWTNDTHGFLSPLYHREEGDDRFVERARREGRVGGFAYIATITKRQRSEQAGRTLLLDSGDTWHGTVVPVRLGGAPVVQVMNAMGYDAMVPGNVEFFYDKDTLAHLIAEAKFPIVAANLYDAEWDERVKLPNLHPYVIKKVGDLKIGIIGMTYHWLSKVAIQPQWSTGLRVEAIQADIDRLRSLEHVDLVVLLSHMGWKVDARYAELVNGIDIIVGAHTHNILYRPTLVYNRKSGRDVVIVQCGSHGKMVGQLDLSIKNKRIVAFAQTLFPVRARDLKPDPGISVLIKKLRAPYKAELERVIGNSQTLIYRQGTWQSTADNLISDALRARTAQDISVTQPSRYGATILPGPITVEDVYNLLPAETPIYQMKFSGRDLRNIFEAAIDNVTNENPLEQVGGNMLRFSGVEITVNLGNAYPDRIEKMLIGGNPVDANKLYSLSEFNMFYKNNSLAVDINKTDRIGPHEVIAYIEEHGNVAPVLDHRITDQHGAILADHVHLHDVWSETGRLEVDLDNAETYQYRGRLESSGRFSLEPGR